MDRLSDSRSAGSSRSKKSKRLPLPSQRTETDSGDLLSIISGGDSTTSKKVCKIDCSAKTVRKLLIMK